MEQSSSQLEIFPWNENFATGIKEIDGQHRVLVGLINRLASHLAGKADQDALRAVFQELADYTHYHFAAEEKIWDSYFGADPWLSTHKGTHGKFFESVLNLKAAEKDKPFDTVVEGLMSFLTQWLAFHILDTDMRMSKVVKAMDDGATLEGAKMQADCDMEGAMRTLVKAVMEMYEGLSARTLQLTREIRMRNEIEIRLRLANVAFESTQDAICIMDADAKVIEANSAFQRDFHEETKIPGMHLSEIRAGLSEAAFVSKVLEDAHRKEHWSGEVHNIVNAKEEVDWMTLSVVRNDENKVVNYVGVFSNVRHLLELQQNLQQIAHHDGLTGLPNRLLLADRLKMARNNALRTKKLLAVCYLDLDDFKPVNDQFGHAEGDAVLKEVAFRLQFMLRSSDTVARLGGDEFVLLAGELENLERCEEFARRVLLEVRKPINLSSGTVQIQASIGYTIYPLDDSDPEALIEHADSAMYGAKRSGKNRHKMYSVADRKVSDYRTTVF